MATKFKKNFKYGFVNNNWLVSIILNITEQSMRDDVKVTLSLIDWTQT